MPEKKQKRNWHPLFDHSTPKRRFPLESSAPGSLGMCMTVASQKGGVGKTTTAVNLAAGLGLSGRKALLFDLDPQSNATSGVGEAKLRREHWKASRDGAREDGTHPPQGIPLLEALMAPPYWLPAVVETDFENLWVLPSFEEWSDLDLVHVLQSKYFAKWKLTLRALREIFDVILIDCPPSLAGLPTLALAASDAVIIPVQCEYYAMEGLSQILPVVEELQKMQNPDLRIAGLLLTMYSSELELSNDVVEEIERYFPDIVYGSIIPRDVTLAESASHGLPIFYYDPLSRGAWSYLNLTREVFQE